jgi:hypothetical protein
VALGGAKVSQELRFSAAATARSSRRRSRDPWPAAGKNLRYQARDRCGLSAVLRFGASSTLQVEHNCRSGRTARRFKPFGFRNCPLAINLPARRPPRLASNAPPKRRIRRRGPFSTLTAARRGTTYRVLN